MGKGNQASFYFTAKTIRAALKQVVSHCFSVMHGFWTTVMSSDAVGGG